MYTRTQLKEELLRTKAYRLFLEELEKHVDFAKLSFLDKEIVQAKSCSEAKVRFHNLKGGAGFFGFSDLAETASDLEKIFKQPLEDLVCEMDKARKMIVELEEMMRFLPVPTSEDKK